MLYSMDWLRKGRTYPPTEESERLRRYRQNAALFDGEHFADSAYRSSSTFPRSETVDIYRKAASRISRVVGNFQDIVSFPTLLNYQRLMSLKMADLVCGEVPSISGSTTEENKHIRDSRDYTEFDGKLYSTIIDLSRYGDAIWRIYKDDAGRNTFTVWDPYEWLPVVSQDGTRTVLQHCIVWRVNKAPNQMVPDWYLHVQVHGTTPADFGHYDYYEYKLNSDGCTIANELRHEVIQTGLDRCAVEHLRSFATSSTVFGYDDYMVIDSILAEIMVRIGQISVILDKHSDPNLTGPSSMLTVNPETGEHYLKTGQFYAVSQGEEQPKYLVWDGQLEAAFKELEKLLDQLYILSEMGAALLGGATSGNQAISGSAMRFKMVNPLAKARRVANSLSLPIRRLFATITETSLELSSIGIQWYDGLPDDPRENIENAKLASGATQMMPLKEAIMEFFGQSAEEAERWVGEIDDEMLDRLSLKQAMVGDADDDDDDDPNKPGPQDGTGVNPRKNKSTTGLKSFHQRKTADDK